MLTRFDEYPQWNPFIPRAAQIDHQPLGDQLQQGEIRSQRGHDADHIGRRHRHAGMHQILAGGGVERGETLVQALARELREEGSIEVVGTPPLHGVF